MGEERLLVPVRTDVSAPVEIMALNETGSVLWTALGAPSDVASLGDTLAAPDWTDPAEQLVAAEQVGDLQRHVGRVLSDLEVEVLRLHADGVGYAEIAGRLQRGAKSVDNALQRIRRKVGDHVASRALEVA